MVKMPFLFEKLLKKIKEPGVSEKLPGSIYTTFKD
jgi:hypothetical protein